MEGLPELSGAIWWLSFVDPRRPAGARFLGACVVKPGREAYLLAEQCLGEMPARRERPAYALDMMAAIQESHLQRCNPGGECKATPAPGHLEPAAEWMNRLLTKGEAAELDASMHQRQQRAVTASGPPALSENVVQISDWAAASGARAAGARVPRPIRKIQ